jgi:aldehyde dehydrogenase (NAD+)
MPAQVDVIRRHVSEALDRGARPLLGGLDSIRPPFVDPIVLADVPDDAALLREETFGPVLPITRVRDADEAIVRANADAYGLGATVYAKRRGMEIARRLDVGMVSINSVLSYAAIPALPFGGRGESGFGRVHGEDGLRDFTRPRAITTQRVRLPSALVFASFARAPWLMRAVATTLRWAYGRRR